MDQRVLQLIKDNRICVVATLLPEGNPYCSALHYSHQEDPLSFLFITEKESYKCKGLVDGKEHPASVVIGFSEEEFKTLQMEGNIKMLTNLEEVEKAWISHSKKFPNAMKRKTDPEFVLLHFVPTRWSYKDLKASPMVRLSSNS